MIIKKEQIKSTSLDENDKVSKINIIIDYQVESFYKLFFNCHCIESICFKKFYRNNIINMSFMFDGCSSLKVLNLNNFNTNHVTNMGYMFSRCSSLKELNINNFNTNNLTNMRYMFSNCSEELKLKLKANLINSKMKPLKTINFKYLLEYKKIIFTIKNN